MKHLPIAAPAQGRACCRIRISVAVRTRSSPHSSHAARVTNFFLLGKYSIIEVVTFINIVEEKKNIACGKINASAYRLNTQHLSPFVVFAHHPGLCKADFTKRFKVHSALHKK